MLCLCFWGVWPARLLVSTTTVVPAKKPARSPQDSAPNAAGGVLPSLRLGPYDVCHTSRNSLRVGAGGPSVAGLLSSIPEAVGIPALVRLDGSLVCLSKSCAGEEYRGTRTTYRRCWRMRCLWQPHPLGMGVGDRHRSWTAVHWCWCWRSQPGRSSPEREAS